jgi:hypothetical protein
MARAYPCSFTGKNTIVRAVVERGLVSNVPGGSAAAVCSLAPLLRIGVKIVGSSFDIDVFFWAVRGDVGGVQSWIVAGDRLWAAE